MRLFINAQGTRPPRATISRSFRAFKTPLDDPGTQGTSQVKLCTKYSQYVALQGAHRWFSDTPDSGGYICRTTSHSTSNASSTCNCAPLFWSAPRKTRKTKIWCFPRAPWEHSWSELIECRRGRGTYSGVHIWLPAARPHRLPWLVGDAHPVESLRYSTCAPPEPIASISSPFARSTYRRITVAPRDCGTACTGRNRARPSILKDS